MGVRAYWNTLPNSAHGPAPQGTLRLVPVCPEGMLLEFATPAGAPPITLARRIMYLECWQKRRGTLLPDSLWESRVLRRIGALAPLIPPRIFLSRCSLSPGPCCQVSICLSWLGGDPVSALLGRERWKETVFLALRSEERPSHGFQVQCTSAWVFKAFRLSVPLPSVACPQGTVCI